MENGHDVVSTGDKFISLSTRCASDTDRENARLSQNKSLLLRRLLHGFLGCLLCRMLLGTLCNSLLGCCRLLLGGGPLLRSRLLHGWFPSSLLGGSLLSHCLLSHCLLRRGLLGRNGSVRHVLRS
ncbi:hypothetical protein TcCL_ESM04344 [Trypanosoma cruzi]|nr:hypothetical protein TcCL_ESM04344 [Trypanosoma cruzi]